MSKEAKNEKAVKRLVEDISASIDYHKNLMEHLRDEEGKKHLQTATMVMEEFIKELTK